MIAIEYFNKGGMVMYLLALLSVYALGVIFFKIYQFRKARVFDREFIDKAISQIRGGDLESANAILSNVPGPVANIMRVSLACVANRDISQKSKEAEIARVGSGDLRYLESHLRGLEMTANVAPLMGLLGTVIGMVAAFARLSEQGTRIDPSMLAGGIWEALITTVGGLIVAIPAMAAYYVIDGVVEKIRATMKDVSIQVLALEEEFKKAEREHKLRETSRKEEEARQREAEARKREVNIALREEEAKRKEAELKAVEATKLKELEERTTTPQESSTLKLLSPKY